MKLGGTVKCDQIKTLQPLGYFVVIINVLHLYCCKNSESFLINQLKTARKLVLLEDTVVFTAILQVFKYDDDH